MLFTYNTFSTEIGIKKFECQKSRAFQFRRNNSISFMNFMCFKSHFLLQSGVSIEKIKW